MNLKLIVSTSAAALFVTAGALAQTSGSTTGSGSLGAGSNPSTPSVGTSGSSTSTPSLGTSGSRTGSSSTGATTGTSRCEALLGLEKERCLQQQGLSSGAGGTSSSTTTPGSTTSMPGSSMGSSSTGATR